jgi:hypothetical protein
MINKRQKNGEGKRRNKPLFFQLTPTEKALFEALVAEYKRENKSATKTSVLMELVSTKAVEILGISQQTI